MKKFLSLLPMLLVLLLTQCDNTTADEISDDKGPSIWIRDLRVFCNYESKYIHQGAAISFVTDEPGGVIFTGSNGNADATGPELWNESSTFTFTEEGTVKVFAKVEADGEDRGELWDFTYEVVADYPGTFDWGNLAEPLSYFAGSEHIPRNDASIVSWPASCTSFNRGLDRDTPGFDDPAVAAGGSTGVVNLGNTGNITYSFSPAISNGEGPDFAVFENGFLTAGGLTAEYAYVEVSSDGENFIRFDTATKRDPSSVPDPEPTMTGWDSTCDWGMAGRYPANFGDPFDLDWLRNKKEVVTGIVDLSYITHIRIADIIGIDEDRLLGPDSGTIPRSDHQGLISTEAENYDSLDSFGMVIFDDYPTVGTGGYDLDTIGVINRAQ